MKSPPIHFGVIAPAEVAHLTGLEFLEGIVAGKFPAPPIAKTLGFRLVEVAKGKATFAGTPTIDVYNPIGSVHGGYAATLLDSAMGVAVHSTLDAGMAYTTLEIKVNYARPLTEKTGEIFAEGKLVHGGSRTATAEGRVVDATGKLYAHGTTTCLIFPVKGQFGSAT
jgi:uncharacterized protein (TIGR00369 family)